MQQIDVSRNVRQQVRGTIVQKVLGNGWNADYDKVTRAGAIDDFRLTIDDCISRREDRTQRSVDRSQ